MLDKHKCMYWNLNTMLQSRDIKSHTFKTGLITQPWKYFKLSLLGGRGIKILNI